MKSHPDATSRSAAEVVTQLPVPSRLGMLRFERLNEASWSLLFLDPACEQQLGLPASELCALLDAPYASLMEPKARHHLHDSIQLQLAQRPHYLVHYTLYTPHGPLRLMELGEPFKQRGRHLLRGYLLRADESREHVDAPHPQNELQIYPLGAQEHALQQARVSVQQRLIVRLAQHHYVTREPLREVAELITRAACEAYQVIGGVTR
jgi:hypothetical protein